MLFAIAGLAIASPVAFALERTVDRPNILLILTDTQRTDSLACMGGVHAVSPNLDRLAREGAVFDQAHSASPVCGPARCSLLTGVYPAVHGALENGLERRTDLPVLPDLLEKQGYRNIYVGKTHFGPVPESFHVEHLLAGEKNQDRDDCYARFIHARGYSRVSAHPNPTPEDLFVDAHCVDLTMHEITRAVEEGAARFFAVCSLLSPHAPLDPPGRWARLFDDRPLPPLNYREGELERQPPQTRRLLDLPNAHTRRAFPDGRPDRDYIDAQRRLYYGLCAYCDHQVGRLLEFLDAAGLRDNTLVIFSSDHGTTLYDHGFEDKHVFYDAAWRVPLILRWPGEIPANQRRGFAGWTDITATILTTAGAPDWHVQGMDLAGPLRRGQGDARGCCVAMVHQTLALVCERWKLEYDVSQGLGRLFDRRRDPLEQEDCYHLPARRELRDALVTALLTWRAELYDVACLRAHRSGGGPVADRAAQWAGALRADQAERNLCRRVAAIEAACDE